MLTESKIRSHNTGIGIIKWLGITVVIGLAAFLASPSGPLGGFWDLQAEPLGGSEALRPLFMLLGGIQSLALGFGVAFLFLGGRAGDEKTAGKTGWKRAAHLAISWSLISWWPHSNFHQTLNPSNTSGLLAIEYGFHMSLILCAVIMAYYFISDMRPRNWPA